jgi:hypothetical protein
MPAEPQWLLRIPEIIDELSALPAPVVDRSVIERAFGVRRRRAIHLLGWFGGYQVGRTFVIEREALLRQLREIASGERFRFEKRRHEKLAEGLERVRKHREAARVRFPAPAPAELPGKSLKNGSVPGREYVVVCNHMVQGAAIDGRVPMPQGRMVRSQRYKYCVYDMGTQRESLVDMQKDPGEMVNVAGDAGYRDILLRHRAMLAEWQRKTNDKFPAAG